MIKQYWKSILWLLFAIAIATFAGCEAFIDPKRFSDMVDLLATIVSILIGISIAVIAVLSTPLSIESKKADAEQNSRIEKVIGSESSTLVDGQVILFFCYFSALGLALIYKWVSSSPDVDYENTPIKVLAFVAASISVFAFLWSVRLPIFLKKAAEQRRFFN